MYFLSHINPLQSVSISIGSFGREGEEAHRGAGRTAARAEPRLTRTPWRRRSRGDSTAVSADTETSNSRLEPLTGSSCQCSLEINSHPNPPTAWNKIRRLRACPSLAPARKGDTEGSARERRTNAEVLLALIRQKSLPWLCHLLDMRAHGSTSVTPQST